MMFGFKKVTARQSIAIVAVIVLVGFVIVMMLREVEPESSTEIDWKVFNDELLMNARAEGRPVLVDIFGSWDFVTAAHQVFFDEPLVLEAISDHSVVCARVDLKTATGAEREYWNTMFPGLFTGIVLFHVKDDNQPVDYMGLEADLSIRKITDTIIWAASSEH